MSKSMRTLAATTCVAAGLVATARQDYDKRLRLRRGKDSECVVSVDVVPLEVGPLPLVVIDGDVVGPVRRVPVD